MVNRTRTPVELTVTGARYGVGHGVDCYGIWRLDRSSGRPLERFPLTAEGWYAAYERWRALEDGAPLASRRPADHGLATVGMLVALALGIVGVFPSYLGGTSLAAVGSDLAAHLVYLIVDAAVLVAFAVAPRARTVAALVGLGTALVGAGLFLADIATAIDQRPAGAGLVLSAISLVVSGLACATMLREPARAHLLGGPGPLHGGIAGLGVLVALGAAITFAPSWDRYVIYISSLRETHTVLLGNAFSNPALVAAADVVTMVLIVAVPLIALSWVPPRHGAPLLLGAALPLVAQVVAAIVQVGEGLSPGAFGFSTAEARSVGLQLTSGLSGDFYGFALLVALLVVTAGVLAYEERSPLKG